MIKKELNRTSCVAFLKMSKSGNRSSKTLTAETRAKRTPQTEYQIVKANSSIVDNFHVLLQYEMIITTDSGTNAFALASAVSGQVISRFVRL